jgi:hypothetical protein
MERTPIDMKREGMGKSRFDELGNCPLSCFFHEIVLKTQDPISCYLINLEVNELGRSNSRANLYYRVRLQTERVEDQFGYTVLYMFVQILNCSLEKCLRH